MGGFRGGGGFFADFGSNFSNLALGDVMFSPELLSSPLKREESQIVHLMLAIAFVQIYFETQLQIRCLH